MIFAEKKTAYPPKTLHQFAIFLAFLTWFLLFAGALVTSTGSGLAVPDWPLSYGQAFPAMVGGVFFEHGHRLIAGTVATLWFLFTVLMWKLEPRKWVRILTYVAAAAVIAQAVLGGMTVLLRLPPEISVAHACLGQSFFCMTVLLAFSTSEAWEDAIAASSEERLRPLSIFALIISVGFFCQLLLGAIMRHIGAGLVIPDFPTVFGGWVPQNFNFAIAVHYAHRVGALTLTSLVVTLAVWVFRRYSESLRLVVISGALMAGVAVQVFLGALVIWMRRPVVPTSVHLAVGAFCLATSLVFTVTVFRSVPTRQTARRVLNPIVSLEPT